MSPFHYTTSHSRGTSDPLSYKTYTTYSPSRSALVRHKTKYTTSDDDLFDDYPHQSSSRYHPSRALTLRRQPTTLEKYGVWSGDNTYNHNHSSSSRRYSTSYDHDDDHDVTYRFKHTTTTSPRHHRSDSDSDPAREYKFKLNASFTRPRSSHAAPPSSSWWPADAAVYKRKEKWEDEGWETRERGLVVDEKSRSRSRTRRGSRTKGWWSDEEEESMDERRRSGEEKTVKYRKVKRSVVDEWKPLSGFRR